MSEQIKKALAQLDPKNDEHWTGEGLPRLDVMKDLVGKDVKRADITQASKSFTRDNPVVEEVAEDAKKDVPETESTEDQAPKEAEATEGEEAEDELVEKEFEEAQEELTKAQKRFRIAQKAMDVVINKRARRDARVTDAHTIQAFQRAQLKARQAKASRKKKLDALLSD